MPRQPGRTPRARALTDVDTVRSGIEWISLLLPALLVKQTIDFRAHSIGRRVLGRASAR